MFANLWLLQFGSSKSTPPSAKGAPDGRTGGSSGRVDELDKASTPSLSSSASSTPEENSPEIAEMHRGGKPMSPKNSRTPSPATRSGLGSSRTASPVSFGYPYRQPMQNGLFSETHTPTAIRG